MRKEKDRASLTPLGSQAVVDTDGRGLRSRRTREKIRAAAGELFVREGIENTTVDQIAQAAGISKGTFYLHFSSKEDVILEYAERRLVHAERLLPRALRQQSALGAIREMVSIVLKARNWNQDIVRSILLQLESNYHRLHSHDLRQLLLPLIEKGISQGEVRTDFPPSTLASFIADAIYNALRNWGMEQTGEDLDQELDHAVTLAFDAIKKR